MCLPNPRSPCSSTTAWYRSVVQKLFILCSPDSLSLGHRTQLDSWPRRTNPILSLGVGKGDQEVSFDLRWSLEQRNSKLVSCMVAMFGHVHMKWRDQPEGKWRRKRQMCREARDSFLVHSETQLLLLHVLKIYLCLWNNPHLHPSLSSFVSNFACLFLIFTTKITLRKNKIKGGWRQLPSSFEVYKGRKDPVKTKGHFCSHLITYLMGSTVIMEEEVCLVVLEKW